MKEFFKVTELQRVLEFTPDFPRVEIEEVRLRDTVGRILAADMVSDADLPDFPRSTVDGFALNAASTFGASEGNPAYFTVKATVAMGASPNFSVGPGEAVRIATGGMLPSETDSVVMIEHTEAIDETTIEVYRSTAPGHNVIAVGEDIQKGTVILRRGRKLRPQETGLLAALGRQTVTVYKRPRIGIISTGDEIVPTHEVPGPGQIRDINTYTLSGLIYEAGGEAVSFGIVRDDFDALFEKCSLALAQCDMTLI
ncbi:MAG: molybdopterin molybdotransferase MoeA, partial [Desulfobacterales bacterium]